MNPKGIAPHPPSSNVPDVTATFATPLVTKEVTPVPGAVWAAGVTQIAEKLAALNPEANVDGVPAHTELGVAVGVMLGKEYTPMERLSVAVQDPKVAVTL